MLKIMLDIDGVLADFVLGFTKHAYCMGFDVPVITTMEHQSWDVFPGLTDQDVRAVWKSIERNDKHFWLSLVRLPQPKEVEQLRRLSETDGLEIYFVSHRETKTALHQTKAWVYRNLGVSPNVLLTKRKGDIALGLGADFAIDDKAGNAVYIKYNSPKTRTYILDRPYNRFPPTLGTKVVRVHTLGEFLDAVEAEALRRGLEVPKA